MWYDKRIHLKVKVRGENKIKVVFKEDFGNNQLERIVVHKLDKSGRVFFNFMNRLVNRNDLVPKGEDFLRLIP
jgi:hypothetical protein